MQVFVIPTWHPTAARPLWCNWVLPHISLLRDSGIDARVLQLGLDDEAIPKATDPWQQPARFLNGDHLYVPVPRPAKRYQQTRFLYGAFLRKYVARLKSLYGMAVEKWGRPDILHAHVSLPGGYAASCLGREQGIPVIVQEHYSGFESDARFWWRKGCFVREMAGHIEGFYAVSAGYAGRIERTGLMEVTGVLPNPIDTELFAPTEWDGKSAVYRIVTAGHLSHIKGTDLLFEALSGLMPVLNWRLTVFGETEELGLVSRWLGDPEFAKRLSLRGKVSQEELRNTYSQSDLYVVSSRIETANVSMLEAMACGVPVVTTSCGGPETLIDGSVGIAVRPNDSQSLARGILQAARNTERYDRTALRRFVEERFSKPAVAQLVLQAYRHAGMKASCCSARAHSAANAAG